ncbi:MAG: cysteine peptidase family C39 domain-containing protein [candidate division WOR-3 bacterium]
MRSVFMSLLSSRTGGERQRGWAPKFGAALLGWMLLGLLGLGGVGFLLGRKPAVPAPKLVLAKPLPWQKELEAAFRKEAYDPAGAAAEYERVARQAASTPEAQYAVGFACYRLGMIQVSQKRYWEAEVVFRGLSRRHLSVPASPVEPSFGSWSEQGAYQAAICAYLRDKQAGIRQMTAFLERYPSSPLVYGAYKRLLRWTKNQPPPAVKRAWRKVEAVQKQRRREAVACGPKALAYALHLLGIEADWKRLMKECGTSEGGTSLWALAQAARRRGLSAVGLEVSQEGLKELEPPFLLYSPSGHYQVVAGSGEGWVLHDPQRSCRMPFSIERLPAGWRGVVLVLRPR